MPVDASAQTIPAEHDRAEDPPRERPAEQERVDSHRGEQGDGELHAEREAAERAEAGETGEISHVPVHEGHVVTVDDGVVAEREEHEHRARQTTRAGARRRRRPSSSRGRRNTTTRPTITPAMPTKPGNAGCPAPYDRKPAPTIGRCVARLRAGARTKSLRCSAMPGTNERWNPDWCWRCTYSYANGPASAPDDHDRDQRPRARNARHAAAASTAAIRSRRSATSTAASAPS